MSEALGMSSSSACFSWMVTALSNSPLDTSLIVVTPQNIVSTTCSGYKKYFVLPTFVLESVLILVSLLLLVFMIC